MKRLYYRAHFSPCKFARRLEASVSAGRISGGILGVMPAAQGEAPALPAELVERARSRRYLEKTGASVPEVEVDLARVFMTEVTWAV